LTGGSACGIEIDGDEGVGTVRRTRDVDCEIASIAETDEACQRLQTLPGVGPLAATAMVAAVGKRIGVPEKT